MYSHSGETTMSHTKNLIKYCNLIGSAIVTWWLQ